MLKWGGVQQPLIRLKQGKRWLRAKGCEHVFLGANRRDGIKTQPGGGFLKIPSKKNREWWNCWAISLASFGTRHCPELPLPSREATAFASLGKAGSLIWCLFEQLRMSADGHVVGVLNQNHPACGCQCIPMPNLASLIVGGRIPQSIWRVSHYFRISFLSQLFRRISEPSTDLEFESIIRMLQKLLAKGLDLMPHIDLLSKVIVSTTKISKKSIVWRPAFFQMGARVSSQASFCWKDIPFYSV